MPVEIPAAGRPVAEPEIKAKGLLLKGLRLKGLLLKGLLGFLQFQLQYQRHCQQYRRSKEEHP
jgi:hypothetical protein